MEIRKVNLSEINQVLELIDQFERQKAPRPTHKETERIFTALEKNGGCVFGAFDHAKVVGTCTVNMCCNFSWSGRPYAIIENVIVSRDYRNQGIGTKLLEKAKIFAQSHNCYKIALMTGSKKDSVIRFYESAGFLGNKTGFQVRFNA